MAVKWAGEQNYTEAARWFHKAAEQGNASAQLNLGGMYAKGRGVPRDHTLAYMWTLIATAYAKGAVKTKAEQNRDILVKHMTSQQIAEAQAGALSFRPQVISGP